MARPLSPLERAIRDALESHPLRQREVYQFGRPFELASTEEIIAAQVAEQNGFGYRWAWVAHRDPIFTPLFTALFSTSFLGGTASFTLFGGAISAASVAAAIATTALSIGLQYLLAPKPPKPEDGRQPLTQPIPYIFFGVGQCRAAGAYVLWEAKDGKLYSVQALMGHRVQGNDAGDGFEETWLHDDKVAFSDGQWRSTEYPDRYHDYITILTRMGTVPETAYSELVADLSADGVWTTNHRGDGTASLAMICQSPEAKYLTAVFPYGKPQPSVVGKWALCWDFRDPSQDPDDPSTWVWTSNPVVQFAWHQCFNAYGEHRDFRRAILPVLDMWQEEADVCDELVPTAAGGTRKRYEAHLVDTTQNGPKSFTNALLAAMDGWTCTRGDGALLIVAGKYREKYCVPVSDADVIGYTLQGDVLFDDECNRLTPVFNYPATGYSSTNTDSFDDESAQIIAGRVLAQEAHYDAVTEWRQARALGLRDWRRIKEKVSGQIFFNLCGINAAYAPWIRLETPNILPNLNGKVVANKKATFDVLKGGFQVDFAKMPDNPADIDLFDPATDEGSAPPVPAKPVSDGIPTPIVDDLVALSDGSSVYLRMTLVDPARTDLTPTIRYRIADTGGGTPGNWITQTFQDAEPDSGLLVLNTNQVPGDTTLEVQPAYVGANGQPGPYATIEAITSTVDATAPLALTSFSVTGGTGQFTAAFTTQADTHLVSAAIYRVPAGGTLDRTAHLATKVGVSSGVAYSVPVTAPVGKWDIYVEALNRSGVHGPTSSAAGIIVIFADSFTRDEDGNLDGGDWTRSGGAAGTFTIASNQVAQPSAVNDVIYFSPDGGQGNQYVQAKVVAGLTGVGGTGPFVALRLQDANNFIGFRVIDNYVALYKRVGGTFTQLGSNVARAVGDVFKLTASGSTLNLYKNGTLALGPITEASLSSVTKAGLVSRGAASPFIDDYQNAPL